MKTIFFGFVFGLLVGGVACYLFFTQSIPVQATMIITSSDPRAEISNEKLEVKTKRQIVEATASFQTDRAGIYTNTITINRRDLQYKHSIYAETGYFLNTQMPFFSLSYSYRWFLISTKIAYSFRLNTIDYGIGIGVKYSF
ncbi:MAG: hypothetical protein ACRC0X_09315 [Brevinema sp.]